MSSTVGAAMFQAVMNPVCTCASPTSGTQGTLSGMSKTKTSEMMDDRHVMVLLPHVLPDIPVRASSGSVVPRNATTISLRVSSRAT